MQKLFFPIWNSKLLNYTKASSKRFFFLLTNSNALSRKDAIWWHKIVTNNYKKTTNGTLLLLFAFSFYDWFISPLPSIADGLIRSDAGSVDMFFGKKGKITLFIKSIKTIYSNNQMLVSCKLNEWWDRDAKNSWIGSVV